MVFVMKKVVEVGWEVFFVGCMFCKCMVNVSLLEIGYFFK